MSSMVKGDGRPQSRALRVCGDQGPGLSLGGARGAEGHADLRSQVPGALREQGSEWPTSFPFGFPGRGGGQADRPSVDQFGFDVATCCGYLPQVSRARARPLSPRRDGQLFGSSWGKRTCSLLVKFSEPQLPVFFGGFLRDR